MNAERVFGRLVSFKGKGSVLKTSLTQEQEDELRAHVLRDALAHLQDVEHAADGTAGGARLGRLRQRLEGRRAAERGPLVRDERVVGHVVCTRGWIGELAALGLGPISVLPTYQRRGIGHALMHAIIAAAEAAGGFVMTQRSATGGGRRSIGKSVATAVPRS